jgi:hypothetical protein
MTQHHEAWLDDTIMLARDTYTETRCQKKFKFVFREEQNFENARAFAHFSKKQFLRAPIKKICGGVLSRRSSGNWQP